MYPSYSHSRLVLCCLDENVNQALQLKRINIEIAQRHLPKTVKFAEERMALTGSLFGGR